MITSDVSLGHDTDLSRPPTSPLPSISVVVPVRNEASCIQQTLRYLTRQRYETGRVEILVIDGESTDATCELVADVARRYSHVKLLANPGRLSSAGRNVGVRAAQGEIVVVVDGHCELDDDRYLLNLAAAFQRSGADCVGRPQPLDISHATPWQQAIAAARSSRLGHHPDSFIYSSQEAFVPAKSVAVAYRREVFQKIGLFDESFDACEDVELNHRADLAGLRCFFASSVAVRYRPRDSLVRLFRQMVRYGRGRVRLLKKHPDTLSLRTFLPLLFVAGLFVGIPLSSAVPALWPFYLGAVFTYAAIVGLGSLAITVSKRNPVMAIRLPLVFATIHIASGAGMLLELPRRRVAPGGSFKDPGHGNSTH